MENICGSYPVIYSEKIIGKAHIEKNGIRYNISARISCEDINGPFRLGAVCGDNIVALGVMMPVGDAFSYSRIFTPNALEELGIGNVSGFTLVTDNSPTERRGRIKIAEHEKNTAPEWKAVKEPWTYFEEGEFRHVFSECREALMRFEGEICFLAIPLVKDEPFPVMQVFCLGEVWKINEQLHLVFKIKDGKLLF